MAVVHGFNWTTRLEVLARADFDGDGDGREDVLLRTLSYGSQGSWSEARIRVLDDTGKPVLAITSEPTL